MTKSHSEPIVLRVYRSDHKDERLIVEFWSRPRFGPETYKRIVTSQERLDMFDLSLSAMVELLCLRN